jgi:hypothetical protein
MSIWSLDVDVQKDPKLAQWLWEIDRDLARQCYKQRCQHRHADGSLCGGKLYCGDYPRSPRGCAEAVEKFFDWRFSFNCAVCDKRATPPSVRFLGRALRISAVLVLIEDRGACSVSWLSKQLEIPVRTVKRWRRWWHERFVASTFWRQHCADFAPPVEEEQLPRSVRNRFLASDPIDKLILLLRFLSPLSTRSGW